MPRQNASQPAITSTPTDERRHDVGDRLSGRAVTCARVRRGSMVARLPVARMSMPLMSAGGDLEVLHELRS